MAIKLALDLNYGNFSIAVDLSLPEKSITTLFGPSGAGKSTLLRCIAGLERANNGYIQIADDVWQDEKQGYFRPTSKRSLGYIFQEPRLFSHLSVQKNLEYGYNRIPKAERRVQWHDVIDVLDIAHLLQRKPSRLSGGEQQRVAIGRALLTSPKLLLMDEPLAALDPSRKQEVLPFIRQLHDLLEIPIIYVSHSLAEVLQITDEMVLLDNGSKVASGTLPKLFSNMALSRYLGDMSGSILETTVTSYDKLFSLNHLTFEGGVLQIPGEARETGSLLRIQILARHVGIALKKPEMSSFLNILPAKIIAIDASNETAHTVQLTLDVGVPLLANISKKSLHDLALKTNDPCYALIKAVSVTGHDQFTT